MTSTETFSVTPMADASSGRLHLPGAFDRAVSPLLTHDPCFSHAVGLLARAVFSFRRTPQPPPALSRRTLEKRPACPPWRNQDLKENAPTHAGWLHFGKKITPPTVGGPSFGRKQVHPAWVDLILEKSAPAHGGLPRLWEKVPPPTVAGRGFLPIFAARPRFEAISTA